LDPDPESFVPVHRNVPLKEVYKTFKLLGSDTRSKLKIFVCPPYGGERLERRKSGSCPPLCKPVVADEGWNSNLLREAVVSLSSYTQLT
jgi:hypothetical protein